jgi:hypothetical protein
MSPEDNEKIKSGQIPICRIDGIRQLGLPENYDSQLNLEVAPKLVRKYIGIRQQVLEKVDGFFDKYLKDKFVLGIHYRGTDKSAEATPVLYPEFKKSICRFLDQNSRFNCLFVSSDEQNFVDFIEDEFRHTFPVFYHDDHERSKTEVAIHRSKLGDRYKKAEEAVLNCLLLSKCNALIKNASFLSAWSKLFNPDLPVILLNSPFERQVSQTPSQWISPSR